MANDRFSIGEALKYGWNSVKGNIGFFIGVTFIALVIAMIPNFLSSRTGGVINTVFTLVGIAVAAFIGLGMVTIGLKVTKDEKAEIPDLFSGTPYFVNGLIAYIILGLATMIGTIFLIIPGIYIGCRLQFAWFFVVEKNLSGIEAIKASWALTKSTAMDLFLLGLAIFAINIVGAIPCGLGLLVTMPVSLVAVSYVYRRLVAEKPVNLEPTTFQP